MRNLLNALWIESLKAVRSRMPVFTTLGSLFLPLAIAFMIFISRNPELSRKLGLISAKANLLAETATNWPTYLGLFAQMIALAGFFLFTLILSWVFGREFADHTLVDLLALPVPRLTLLLAKFIVAVLWCAAQTLIIFALSLLMGALLKLPEGSEDVILHGIILVATSFSLTIAVVLPFALFASAGRGYLLPIGLAILALMMANVVAIAGWGEYFPWAIPGLYSTISGEAIPLTPASYWIVILTGLAGMIGTYGWWMRADQSR